MAVGLDSPVGIGGGRLSLPQRQKLGLARAILKRPDILVLLRRRRAARPARADRVARRAAREFAGRTVIWALQHDDWAARFDQVLVMEEGRVVATGAFRRPGEGPARVRQLAAAS